MKGLLIFSCFFLLIVSVSGQVVTTVAGNGTQGNTGDGGLAINAKLRSPYNIALDTAGNIYFVDSSRIRRIDITTGIITSIAGTGVSVYGGDGGLAVDARLHAPFGLAVDSTGNVYFSELYQNVIRKINKSTGIINLFAGTIGFQPGFSGDGGLASLARFASIRSLCFDKKGDLLIIDNARIRKINMKLFKLLIFYKTWRSK